MQPELHWYDVDVEEVCIDVDAGSGCVSQSGDRFDGIWDPCGAASLLAIFGVVILYVKATNSSLHMCSLHM